MKASVRRVARLEASARPPECARCRGAFIGVVFQVTGCADYEVGPGGETAPMPLSCPNCGRRMPKVYCLSDRACWDGITRGGL